MEIALILWLIMGIFAAVIAGSKGRSAAGFGCAGVLLGPFGILWALLADPGEFSAGNLVACPSCAEGIRPGATDCRHCGAEIPEGARRPPDAGFALALIGVAAVFIMAGAVFVFSH